MNLPISRCSPQFSGTRKEQNSLGFSSIMNYTRAMKDSTETINQQFI